MNLQPASNEVFIKKYAIGSETTPDQVFDRVASQLSQLEENPEVAKADFMWALQNGAIPAGRILANAGAESERSSVSTINCTVSRTIEDSMKGILDAVHDAGLTLKAGCGIGYEFSTLRPRGAYVAGAGASTSGPMSFMDIFDKTCFTVSSAGGRRGAQMATFDVRHPDVEDFIKAKREDGRLRQFNLSLLITQDFLDAVASDASWHLRFPVLDGDLKTGFKLENALWEEWPTKKGYTVNNEGLVAMKVYRTIPAKKLWNLIMSSTYDFAEPGFILIDKVNEMNNNWFCEVIRATNPCGEQPLPEFGACLLGSINLTHFVNNPFSDVAEFDYDKYAKVVRIFTRMLDNVVEINGLPLEQQREEIKRKRRHGMGILGLGSTLAMLGVRYGSKQAATLTEEISKLMAIVNYREGLVLAKEKGPAPLMDEEFVVTGEILRKRPELIADGFCEGDKVTGKVLWSYSRFIQQLKTVDPDLFNELKKYGCRFTHATSIAPTGTISLSVGNNASNGIEPSFAHHYKRNVIVEGKKSKEQVDVWSYELLMYRLLVNESVGSNNLPKNFVSSDELTPSEHIIIQAAAQKWVDSSISKTINVPTSISFEDFESVYLEASQAGLKGCTTFRYNPEVFSGVLVKEDDLKNTTYEFTLEDGTTVNLRGDEKVEYDGEVHTAANLFDALKEGYYGKL